LIHHEINKEKNNPLFIYHKDSHKIEIAGSNKSVSLKDISDIKIVEKNSSSKYLTQNYYASIIVFVLKDKDFSTNPPLRRIDAVQARDLLLSYKTTREN